MQINFKQWWNEPLVRFAAIAFFLYVIWFLFYDLWLHPIGSIDAFVINQIVNHTDLVLQFIGFETLPPNQDSVTRISGIVNSTGVWIGDECNGITLFALFAGFVIAFPGPAKRKAWFIPIGLLLIHFVNVLRVAGLAILAKFKPTLLDFNHTYTFTIIVYSLVFVLWYLWANKLANLEKKA